jgi:dGTPase
MDHADAIAYSVHDVDDFYRAGLIPLEDLQQRLKRYIDHFIASKKLPEAMIGANMDSLRDMLSVLPTDSRYGGTNEERVDLQTATSTLIGNFISPVSVRAPGDPSGPLLVPDAVEVQMRFLQDLVWRFVIHNPRLATQQRGQRKVISELFAVYRKAVLDGDQALVPAAYRHVLKKIHDGRGVGGPDSVQVTRLAVDIVAGFTDKQAAVMFCRLTGSAFGSVTDLLDG